jgi:hypothetical protein
MIITFKKQKLERKLIFRLCEYDMLFGIWGDSFFVFFDDFFDCLLSCSDF